MKAKIYTFLRIDTYPESITAAYSDAWESK